ncbi:MAG: trypsin-like peptidase domain-containing protein [Lachnospiraceae bacterium]|nr:trypsin-like peptidase domain-containing protein [Lachnospiraceae bacterium]
MNDNRKEKRNRLNAWKRYGAIFMASVLLTGSAAGVGSLVSKDTVQAEEKKEVTLNIAEDDAKDENADAKDENADAEDKNEDVKDEDADDDSDDKGTQLIIAEPEEAEETEEKRTFEPIDKVQADTSAIVTTDVSNIVENCMPSIVSITTKSVEEVETYFYGVQEYEAEGAGSGIIIAQNDEELLVATNSHVVADSTDLSVGFTVDAEEPEDLVVPAKIKGMDKNYELAVLAVRLEDIKDEVRDQLKIATLGSSDSLKVGEASIAIGNALGYGQSVTCGIISALNREATIDNFTKELILTDASINFGNSGGALLNSKGQVIGINVAKEAGDSAEGMGYSIPIDTAIPVLKNLINKETRDKMSNSERGYLGATVVNVSTDAKELYNMPEGAFVSEVSEDSAAEKAGIKKGDVITKFDGESVTSSDDLIDKISYYAVGETVTIEVQTANSGEYESREVEVTLQKGTAVQTEETEDEEDYDSDDGIQQFNFPEDGFPSGDDFNMFPFGNGNEIF